MKIISLVTPTRARPNRFAQMVASAVHTASDPARVRVDALVDADDPQLKSYLLLESKNVSMCVADQRMSVAAAFDYRARRSLRDGADVLMLCSDDVLFRTPSWDAMIAAHIERYPDRLLLIAPNDACGNGKANFWFITREFMEAVGYFCWPGFEHFCCDTMTEVIAKRAGRFVYAREVLCEHMHPKYGRAEMDELYKSKRVRAADGTNMSDRDIARMRALQPEIEAAAARIAAAALQRQGGAVGA